MDEMKKISENFPLLHDNDFIYLDSAATSQKPQQVIDAVSNFYERENAPVHRGLYPLAETATIKYEKARDCITQFINAAEPCEVIFTKGTTEGINFIASSWALENVQPGDEILLTQAEHHANLLPWQWVAAKTGATLVFIPIDKTTYELNDPCSYISAKTKLVAVTHSSNVLGPIWSDNAHLKNFIDAVHQAGAVVLLDAAQSVAHQKLDVRDLGADFVVFSGHKMFGPTGIGVLYINKKYHGSLEPYQRGGSMVHHVSFNHATWAQSPQKFEAGTPPIAQAIGLGAAVDFIQQSINFEQLKQHEADLCKQLIQGLKLIPDVTIVGNQEQLVEQGHLVSFAMRGIHPHDIATQLGLKGIAVRAGHFCAQPLVTELGFESLLRVSMAAYNTSQEIESFLQELEYAINLFKRAL